MTRIGFKVTGAKGVANALERTFMAAMARNRRDALLAAGFELNAAVKRGRWFDNDRGRLKGSLFVGKPRMTKTRGSIDVGWGGAAAAYGSVLETGPGKKTWTIAPKNKSAAGKPIKALRFAVGGRVVYAKKVTHRWTPAQLRPHYKPALRQVQPKLDTIFSNAIAGARRTAGL